MKALIFATSVTFLVIASLVQAAQPAPERNDWAVGVWNKTHDEDKSPPDVIELKPNGTFISYGPSCQTRVNTYFVARGLVYLTVEIPNKGPVALVFRPNTSHSKLTFTSPRTLNNATYERLKSAPCAAKL